MLVIIDNYDSFTYNLVHYFEMLGTNLKVIRNDAATVQDCLSLNPSHLVIGPGPGNPSSAGICKKMIEAASEYGIPLLGVCLGMQAIAEVYGGKVVRAPLPMHGKVSKIIHHNKGLFSSFHEPLFVARYHSLIVSEEFLPPVLEITAKAEDGAIMGLKHVQHKIEGVQFHPESIMTPSGLQLLKNFLDQK